MNKLLTTTAVLGSTALVAVPLTLLATTSASAVEKSGTCGGARFELDVEKDDGRFEVEADIDNARPGSQWRVVLRHDGKVVYNQVRTADREGDVSVDRDRPNTAGDDRFRLNVRKVGTDTICSRVITLR